MLIKAKIKENDNLLKERWLLHYSTEESFEDFKQRFVSNQIDKSLTEEEIMEDVEGILSLYRGGE